MEPGFDILTLLVSAALLPAHGSPSTHVGPQVLYHVIARGMSDIAEEIGAVTVLRKSLAGTRLTILASMVMDDLKIGDSVSVNRICLHGRLEKRARCFRRGLA